MIGKPWVYMLKMAPSGPTTNTSMKLSAAISCHFPVSLSALVSLKAPAIEKKKKTPNLSKLSNECNPEIKAQMDHIFTFHPKSFEVITPC